MKYKATAGGGEPRGSQKLLVGSITWSGAVGNCPAAAPKMKVRKPSTPRTPLVDRYAPRNKCIHFPKETRRMFLTRILALPKTGKSATSLTRRDKWVTMQSWNTVLATQWRTIDSGCVQQEGSSAYKGRQTHKTYKGTTDTQRFCCMTLSLQTFFKGQSHYMVL